MDGWQIFCWGALGSISLDVVSLWRALQQNHYRLSFAHRQIGFYVIRVFVALVAGGLALALDAKQPILAFQIGVATPLIIDKFARRPPSLP